MKNITFLLLLNFLCITQISFSFPNPPTGALATANADKPQGNSTAKPPVKTK